MHSVILWVFAVRKGKIYIYCSCSCSRHFSFLKSYAVLIIGWDVWKRGSHPYKYNNNKQKKHKMAAVRNGCRWELCGNGAKFTKKEGKKEWGTERGRAASQWISHSRPGLSAGGCARGAITGLLPRWSLHRHTVIDRRLLAPGHFTDSPQHCFLTATFSGIYAP